MSSDDSSSQTSITSTDDGSSLNAGYSNVEKVLIALNIVLAILLTITFAVMATSCSDTAQTTPGLTPFDAPTLPPAPNPPPAPAPPPAPNIPPAPALPPAPNAPPAPALPPAPNAPPAPALPTCSPCTTQAPTTCPSTSAGPAHCPPLKYPCDPTLDGRPDIMHAICQFKPAPWFQKKRNHPVVGYMKFRQERGKKLTVEVNVTHVGVDYLYRRTNKLNLDFRVHNHGDIGGNCSATKGSYELDGSKIGFLGRLKFTDCNDKGDDCSARGTIEPRDDKLSLFGGKKSIIGRAGIIFKGWQKTIACCVIGFADPDK